MDVRDTGTLRAQKDRLLAALKALTQDSRFNIVIGGNPNAVDALVKQVDEAIAFAEASPAPAVEHGIPEGTCGVCYHLCDRCSHCDTQPAPASPDAGLVEPYDWARLGKLLQTGGMDDPAFLIGQVKGLLFHVASLSREHEALKAERES